MNEDEIGLPIDKADKLMEKGKIQAAKKIYEEALALCDDFDVMFRPSLEEIVNNL